MKAFVKRYGIFYEKDDGSLMFLKGRPCCGQFAPVSSFKDCNSACLYKTKNRAESIIDDAYRLRNHTLPVFVKEVSITYEFET